MRLFYTLLAALETILVVGFVITVVGLAIHS